MKVRVRETCCRASTREGRAGPSLQGRVEKGFAGWPAQPRGLRRRSPPAATAVPVLAGASVVGAVGPGHSPGAVGEPRVAAALPAPWAGASLPLLLPPLGCLCRLTAPTPRPLLRFGGDGGSRRAGACVGLGGVSPRGAGAVAPGAVSPVFRDSPRGCGLAATTSGCWRWMLGAASRRLLGRSTQGGIAVPARPDWGVPAAAAASVPPAPASAGPRLWAPGALTCGAWCQPGAQRWPHGSGRGTGHPVAGGSVTLLVPMGGNL